MATSSAKKKTTPPKSTAAKSAAPKAAVKATVAAPRVAVPDMPLPAPLPMVDMGSEPGAVVIEKAAKAAAPQLRKKDLVARVITALDGKKKGQVKEIVEATLAALGAALAKGESLNLPPFGRARIARQKGEGKASSMTVKLRGAGEKNAAKGSKQALAEAGEDD